mgnify:CR=1 FL=1
MDNPIIEINKPVMRLDHKNHEVEQIGANSFMLKIENGYINGEYKSARIYLPTEICETIKNFVELKEWMK